MRFLVDAQLPAVLAAWLRSRGHEAEHVSEIGFQMQPDSQIVLRAIETGAIIVTKDADFSISAVRLSGCRVLWLRIGNVTNESLFRRLEPVFAEAEAAFKRGDTFVEVRP